MKCLAFLASLRRELLSVSSKHSRASSQEWKSPDMMESVHLNGTETDGGSLVEFALILPMMMILITGMFSIGIALNSFISLTNGVNAGARAFAMSRLVTVKTAGGGTTTITDPCAYAVQAAQSTSPGVASGSVTFQITWTTTNSSGTSVSTSYSNTCPGLGSSISAGDNVQMKASYPFTLILYGWRPGSLAIQAQTAELIQ